MFTGLQNDNWVPIPSEPNTPPGSFYYLNVSYLLGFDIIQPVLQYGGDSEDGGGDYWALARFFFILILFILLVGMLLLMKMLCGVMLIKFLLVILFLEI